MVPLLPTILLLGLRFEKLKIAILRPWTPKLREFRTTDRKTHSRALNQHQSKFFAKIESLITALGEILW